MFFDEGLTCFHARVHDAREAIHLGTQLLLDAGCVTSDFEGHVLEREGQFPTGLDVAPVGVALPHTDCAYVRRSQIAFVSLATPVEFGFMADAKRRVRVGLVLVLAMSQPHEQVETLSALMSLISNPDEVASLCSCSTNSELMDMLSRHSIR